ncbi:MAG: MoaD family protein [Candidatus Helarchaeota archaeon]
MPDEQIIDDERIEQSFDIKVNFLSTLPKIIGIDESITININPGTTISDLLDILVEKLGESFIKVKNAVKSNDNKAFGDAIVILINGRNISAHEGLETILNKGDEVTMFVPLGGG